MPTKVSKSENAVLREWANEARESKLHEFHDGISRELYKHNTGFPPHVAVARAIAVASLMNQRFLSRFKRSSQMKSKRSGGSTAD